MPNKINPDSQLSAFFIFLVFSKQKHTFIFLVTFF